MLEVYITPMLWALLVSVVLRGPKNALCDSLEHLLSERDGSPQKVLAAIPPHRSLSLYVCVCARACMCVCFVCVCFVCVLCVFALCVCFVCFVCVHVLCVYASFFLREREITVRAGGLLTFLLSHCGLCVVNHSGYAL